MDIRFYLNPQFIRFIMVGGVNTLVGYSLYALFVFLHFNYASAAFLATVLGVLFNYNTTGRFVFKHKDNKLFHKFLGVYAISYVFNLLCINIFVLITANMYLAGLCALFPVALMTFILNKRLVFKDVYEIN